MIKRSALKWSHRDVLFLAHLHLDDLLKKIKQKFQKIMIYTKTQNYSIKHYNVSLTTTVNGLELLLVFL